MLNLSSAIAAILNFISEQKKKLCREPSNEHSYTVRLQSDLRFWNIFPIGSNVKLSPAVATILDFISEQKT
jgi:hypothetical protein